MMMPSFFTFVLCFGGFTIWDFQRCFCFAFPFPFVFVQKFVVCSRFGIHLKEMLAMLHRHVVGFRLSGLSLGGCFVLF
jgi:hypothetical protein